MRAIANTAIVIIDLMPRAQPVRRPPVVSLDAYIIDTLMPDLVGHDRTPAAFIVFVYLWRQNRMLGGRPVAVSHKTMAEDTGLSKSAVQGAIRLLKRRQLVTADRRSITAVPEYRVRRLWVRRTPA
jgi:hypothetical protein